ncbi:MAG TPA: hypothetical protein VGP93_15805, partial [Polyangiaceae bacterium]|nr:hypothetical protein [Polyangiaceae bacterium]
MSDEGDCSWLGWYDLERDEACSFRLSGDGSWRCLPDSAVTADVAYKDEGCHEELFSFPEQPCGSSARTVLQFSQEACDSRAIVREMGAQSVTPPSFSAFGGGCNALYASGTDWYEPGPELPLEAFAPAELGTEPSDGRITRQVLHSRDGAFEPRQLFDLERSGCEVTLADDGVRRCLPVRPVTSGIYAEATCSEPALLADVCAPESPATALAVASGCPTRYAIHERGEPIEQVYGRNGEQCDSLLAPGPTMYKSAGLV